MSNPALTDDHRSSVFAQGAPRSAESTRRGSEAHSPEPTIGHSPRGEAVPAEPIAGVESKSVAYFSMEIGLVTELPTYAGGLGVLAGDTLRAAADLRVPMVAVTLLHRKGYFRQVLDLQGHQTAEPVNWVVGDYLTELPERVSVTLEGRTVFIRSWMYEVTGSDGYRVPIYFLDTNLPDNEEGDRGLTDALYGGDPRYRFCQEVILGIGGVRILNALGHAGLNCYHINEGHASLLTVELLSSRLRSAGREELTEEHIEAVRRRCVFTTHTPVPAGHDRFPRDMVTGILEPSLVDVLQRIRCLDDSLNMTVLAMQLSRKVNGVSVRHGEVSRRLFSPHPVEAITNGVHVPTWASVPVQELLDRFAPGWKEDSFRLRYALRIPNQDLWQAHRQSKLRLIDYINRETNVGMHIDCYTIGFARRAALYKRGDLLFDDIERLQRIHADHPFQLIYAGKAHPHDQGAKELIQRIFHARDRLKHQVKIVYLENYDIRLCRLMVGGVDLWLNTPEPPLEASGTSGMKAALNGVPSLSVLDGWWVEGCIENVTGWSIGKDDYLLGLPHDRGQAARQVYDKLEYVILPMYYQDRDRYLSIMKHAIAINGAFFSTHRMMQQYVTSAYLK